MTHSSPCAQPETCVRDEERHRGRVKEKSLQTHKIIITAEEAGGNFKPGDDA